LSGVADPLDLDHAQPVRGHGHLELVDGQRVERGEAREHQLLVGVLVIGHEQRPVALPIERQHREVVVVVAELAGLRLPGLLVRVEGGGAGDDLVAPADHHRRVVPVRHDQGVELVGWDRLERERGRPGLRGERLDLGHLRSVRSGRFGRERRCRAGQAGAGRADDERTQRAGPDQAAPGQAGGDDVAEVGIVGLVGHRMVARVAAPVLARHRAPSGVTPPSRADDRQQPP
jgi:hypothetical protein